MDPYYRTQVALANIISFNSTNQVNPLAPTVQEYNLWAEFYVPFWETMFRAYVKRIKAKDPEVATCIEEGYTRAIKGRLSIPEYSNILFAIGKLYDDLKYSSPEKECIESPFDCNLKMAWSL